jgi:CheY-like chemotaxis protein/two-component sensor histidine kinase
VTDCLNEVIGASDLAANLTSQMLTFGRKDCFEAKTVVGADIVRSLVTLIQPLLPETIALRVLIDDANTRIKVDAAQVTQAVMNLVLNARDSMPAGGTVELRVTLGSNAEGTQPGQWLVYSVADEGTGIDEETLPRIFEPFFTKKAQGQGTGLGLSVTHGVVQRSGGAITVKSRLGVGSTFSLYLPIAIDDQAPDEPSPPIGPATHRGDGYNVMVVEDEPAVRRFVQRTLQAQGYHVRVAASYTEMSQWLMDGAEPVDLLLTDVVLPGKSGPELATEMRQRFPEVQVLFMSGYVTPDIQQLDLIQKNAAVMKKPFTPAALCRAVSQALASSRSVHGTQQSRSFV